MSIEILRAKRGPLYESKGGGPRSATISAICCRFELSFFWFLVSNMCLSSNKSQAYDMSTAWTEDLEPRGTIGEISDISILHTITPTFHISTSLFHLILKMTSGAR